MKARDIRRKFLEFFETRNHHVVPSSPLVLPNDPTLLFANAGMNQFKDVFTGRDHRAYDRAVSVQKCLRVSGKHNDLEMVGRTPRHHTFFEMLGNFSFGDYFKERAIELAWELVTDEFGLPPERLWISVFGGSENFDADEESLAIWRDRIGCPAERIVRLGEGDNFWRMGDTGPCGPCSEIYFDLDPGSGSGDPSTDESRFLEIWNLVFMQFDARADGSTEELPRPSIDTGMGLERISAVLQGKRSNYETDLFVPLLEAAAEEAGVRVGADESTDFALRVIADHVRALCFLVADGVVPANDRRGYVLRRLLRRAIRFGRKIGIERPFLGKIVPVVVAEMSSAYTDLSGAAPSIGEVALREERRFADTLSHGLGLLEQSLEEDEGGATGRLDGEELFRLYDTFGLPLDLVRDVAEERGITLDEEGFERQLAAQRERARASWKGARVAQAAPVYEELAGRHETCFVGYEEARVEGAKVVALIRDGEQVPRLEEGSRGEVVLDRTPFYAESGGQVGDRGLLVGRSGRASVEAVQRPVAGLQVHPVHLESGSLALEELVDAEIDGGFRRSVARNHTATHLLHAALREVIGTHVKQAGSLVAVDRLRFDFSHFAPLSDSALAEIETIVNGKVLEDEEVSVAVMPLDEALRSGAMALFGEKYGEQVRVVGIGEFSKELCGGTHTERTGQIGLIKLVQERGVASGTRRVEAISGEASLARFQRDDALMKDLEEKIAAPRDQLLSELERRLDQLRKHQRELEQFRVQAVRKRLLDSADEPRNIEGIPLVVERVEGLSAAELREVADALRQRLRSGVVVLGRGESDKASLLVSVTPDLKGRVHAGKLVKRLAAIIGGGGGGRPDLAEAGGRDVARLDEALAQAPRELAASVGGAP